MSSIDVLLGRPRYQGVLEHAHLLNGKRSLAQWPKLPDVLGPSRTRRWFQRWRYQLLLLFTAVERQQLLQTLDRFAAWRQLLDSDLSNYFVFYRRYLDRNIPMRQRFQAMITDLEVAYGVFGSAVAHQLAQGRSVRLCQSEQFSIDLCINQPTRIEGFCALTLNSNDGQALFNMSFGFIAPGKVLIASIQGLKREFGDNRQVIRDLTKCCHGMRPHALLLEVFKMACAHWGIAHLEGIDPRRQVTLYKKGIDEFQFDYRNFWSESNAQQMHGGNWRIPAQVRTYKPDDVAPQKRAMNRKRVAMLEHLAVVVPEVLAGPLSHPGTSELPAARA